MTQCAMTEEAPECGGWGPERQHDNQEKDRFAHFHLDVRRSHNGVLSCLFVWFEGFMNGLRLW